MAYSQECRDPPRRLRIIDPEAKLKLMHGFTALGIDTPRVRAMVADLSDKLGGAKSSIASDLDARQPIEVARTVWPPC